MKFIALLITALTFQLISFAQLTSANRKVLSAKEDSLKRHAMKIIQGFNPNDRLAADSQFTKIFVRALKVPHSFNYKFDSLFTISQLYPPDSSFRIFTWQLVINENVIRQHGAIQMKTTDGSLKLFPLIDKSDVIKNVSDTVGNHLGWMGAVYYKLVAKKHNDKTYYTLLGYDENNIRSNRKIIEVLDFKDGQPVFGGRYFSMADNQLVPKTISRYIMEYKKEASPRLTYDDELDMIIMEHLISTTNEPNKKWTLVGDGDYEGFKWLNGKWTYINKVFNLVTPENQPPTPKILRDADGNIDEAQLGDYEVDDKDPKATPKKKPVKVKKKD